MFDETKAPVEKSSQRFIGPRLVIGASIDETVKTHGGAEVVWVHYDGVHKEIMPKLAYELLVTEAPTDYNDLRKRKIGEMILGILAFLAERDLKAGEIESLKTSLENELFNSFNRATHFLWSKDDAAFTPGYNVVMDRSLLEADIIIKSIPQSNPDVTKPTGETQTPEAA